MIEPAIGALTIVNLNQAEPAFFWNGEKLAHVTACFASLRDHNSTLMLRVFDPAMMVPALPTEEVTRLNALYAAMEESNVDIKKVRP
jgi:hypothetical protein